jgi:hypothetical protein
LGSSRNGSSSTFPVADPFVRASFDKAVKDYPGAVWKSFNCREEAQKYFKENKNATTLPKNKVPESKAKGNGAGSKPTALPRPDPPAKRLPLERKCKNSQQTPSSGKSEAHIEAQVVPSIVYRQTKRESARPPEPVLTNFLDSKHPSYYMKLIEL